MSLALLSSYIRFCVSLGPQSNLSGWWWLQHPSWQHVEQLRTCHTRCTTALVASRCFSVCETFKIPHVDSKRFTRNTCAVPCWNMPFSLLLRTPLIFFPLTDHLRVLMNRVVLLYVLGSFHTRRDQAQFGINFWDPAPSPKCENTINVIFLKD